MVDAVSGMTDGGNLSLHQIAQGGDAGDTGTTLYRNVAGPAGSATSQLRFDDTAQGEQSEQVSVVSEAHGG